MAISDAEIVAFVRAIISQGLWRLAEEGDACEDNDNNRELCLIGGEHGIVLSIREARPYRPDEFYFAWQKIDQDEVAAGGLVTRILPRDPRRINKSSIYDYNLVSVDRDFNDIWRNVLATVLDGRKISRDEFHEPYMKMMEKQLGFKRKKSPKKK